MVEGCNEARAQWIGRTSQNKTLNFTAPQGVEPKIGTYASVLVTRSFPNSLVGEMSFSPIPCVENTQEVGRAVV